MMQPNRSVLRKFYHEEKGGAHVAACTNNAPKNVSYRLDMDDSYIRTELDDII